MRVIYNLGVLDCLTGLGSFLHYTKIMEMQKHFLYFFFTVAWKESYESYILL